MSEQVPVHRRPVDFSVGGNVLRIGGMRHFSTLSVIYDASTEDGRRFMVKVPTASGAGDLCHRRERDALETLKGQPNVLPQKVCFDGFQHLFVSPYVEGGSLERYIRENGAMNPLEVRRVGIAVATVLEYLHGLGYLYRDVKPANILFTQGGQVYLTDFGLCVKMEEVDRPKGSSSLVGTVQYMAPEQVRRSVQSTVKTDIYHLGITMACLLLGGHPFVISGDSMGQVLAKATRGLSGEGQRRLRRACPALAVVIDSCTRPKSDERFGRMKVVREHLQDLSIPLRY